MNNLQLSVLLSAVDKMSGPVKAVSQNINELSNTLRQNRAEYRKLANQEKENNAAIEKYRTTLNPLKSKLAELNQQLGQAQQQAKYFEQQLARAKQPTAEFKAKVENAQNAVKKLKNEQSSTAQKLRQTREELKRNGISAETLGKRQDELRNKLKGANAQVKQQENALKGLNVQQAKFNAYRGKVDKLKEKSGNAQMFGVQSIAAGTALTRPIANTVGTFMEFEDAMMGVARQVQGLKDDSNNFTPEFDEWKQKIQDLSKELPLTTVEIANMIESAARMDVPKEQLEDFVRLNTQMATAFDAANPDELVEKYGKVTKNFKLSAEASKELADAINYLDDNAISKGTEIIGFMNRVSGIAGIAKISSKNMAALGSTLQTAGAAEEQSATAVNAMFTRLSSASKKKPVKNGLAAIGLSPQAIERGMAKDAQATLMKIVNAVKKAPEHKQLGIIADLVGTEHSKTLALLVANTEEWVRQIGLANSEMAKGSMNREFETRMKALSSTWGIFKNQIFNLSATIGGTLAPTLDKLMKKFSGIIESVKNWIVKNPELSSWIISLTGSIGAALIALGAFAFLMSFIYYPALRLVVGFKYFIATAMKLGGVLTLLKTSMAVLLSPIGLVITAVTGLSIAIYYLWKNWDTVKQALIDGWNWVCNVFDNNPILNVIFPIIPLIRGIISIYQNWGSNTEKITNAISEKWESLKNSASSVFSSIAQWISDVLNPLDSVKNGVQWLIDNLGKISFDGITQGAKDIANSVKNSVSNTLSNSWDWAKNKLGMSSATTETVTLQQKWVGGYVEKAKGFATGGYTGNGGKYQPMGIVHGGEYVMTKDATARLGLPLLNALNYSKNALLATGLGVSVATASPVKIDDRPPLKPTQNSVSTTQPMNVSININATQGQDPNAIAKEVARQLAQLQQKAQIQARNRLGDRD